MSAVSFSTGQIFGHWLDWKDDTDSEWSELFNGYTRSQLYIEPIYESLKDEVIESNFIDIKQWSQHFQKANPRCREGNDA